MYGNEMRSRSIYYGSYNDNGRTRCFKNLSKQNLSTGDMIKVCLDMNKWRIKLLLFFSALDVVVCPSNVNVVVVVCYIAHTLCVRSLCL